MTQNTEPITELGALLSALWINDWGSRKTYAHIHYFLPDTCKVEVHFDDGKGHSNAFTSTLSDVDVVVFQKAQQKNYVTAALKPGYVSKTEFVLTSHPKLLEEIYEIIAVWRKEHYCKKKSAYEIARGKSGTYIKIVSLPEGEAPEEIRRAWIGLILPCEPTVGRSKSREKGVLSLKENARNRYCYSVPQKEALEILVEQNPTAASWWKEHGFPQSDVGAQCFSFSDSEAKEIAGKFEHQKVLVVTEEMEGDPGR